MCSSCNRLDIPMGPGRARWIVEIIEGEVISAVPVLTDSVLIRLADLPAVLADPAIVDEKLLEKIRRVVG